MLKKDKFLNKEKLSVEYIEIPGYFEEIIARAKLMTTTNVILTAVNLIMIITSMVLCKLL